MGGRAQQAFGSLPGRSYWARRLDEECARAERYQRPFAVLLLALHSGDPATGTIPLSEAVVAMVAETLKRELRGSDVVCRLAPSRFAALLIETNDPGAQAAARRIRSAIDKDIGRCLPAGMVPAVVIGQSVYAPDCASPSALMETAEMALRGQTPARKLAAAWL